MNWDLFDLLLPVLCLVIVSVTLGLWQLKRLVLGQVRLPYTRRETLNSPMERAFFTAVTRAVGKDVHVACKVRVADVLDVAFRQRHPRDQRWWRYFRLISSKHVDLVLCEPNGGRILIAIELDDRSHRRSDRKRRDNFVNRAFASAGLPLLRFPAGQRFDVGEIRVRLEPYIAVSE